MRAVLPALRYLHDDPQSSIRWAAAELEKNCAPRPGEGVSESATA
ncbi:hypothetical protein [Streptomyces sp. NPDC058739]